MGIDIYLRWKDITEEEVEKQYTGFSLVHGHVGYLREAYHGKPYATKILMPEAFDEARRDAEPDTSDANLFQGVPIPASLLRERLTETLRTVRLRVETLYNPGGIAKEEIEEAIRECQQSFVNFVELAEKKEKETGQPCKIYASF